MHIHFIANRIGLDGKVYDTSYVSNRASRVAEQISRDAGLTIAKDVKRQAPPTPDRSSLHRQVTKDNLTRIANDELSRNHPNIDRFFKSLEDQGVRIELPRNKKGNMFGIRFSMYGQTFKGSDIGKQFGLHSLSGHFGLKVEGNGFVQKSNEEQYRDSSRDHHNTYSSAPALHGSYNEQTPDEIERIRRRKKNKTGHGL